MGNDVQVVAPKALIDKTQPFNIDADKLIAVANEAVIDSPERYDGLADYLKTITTAEGNIKDARTSLVKPLNDHVKWINDTFKPITDKLADAKKIFKAKGSDWVKIERKRIQEEEAAAQAIRDAEILAAAEQAAEEGDDGASEAILEMAEEQTAPDLSVKGRGGYTGASISAKSVWKGEVGDKLALVKAVAEGKLPLDIISAVSKTELNNFAKQIEKEGLFNGIQITEVIDTSAR